MEIRTLLFERPGKHNTDATLAIARERAAALGVKQVVVASTHGFTARKAQELLGPDGIVVTAVSICHGFESVGWAMDTAVRRDLEAMGIRVHTGIHALGDGVASAFTEKSGGKAPEEIVRETLYRFCQGMKVAVEVLLMAADAGLVDMTGDAIAIAGTGEGADTAIVCKPAYPRTFHDLVVREILAKPR
jgi:uncharacterized protein